MSGIPGQPLPWWAPELQPCGTLAAYRRAWDMLPYDDEDDARAHLDLHGPDAFLVAREVTVTLWGRVEDG